MRLPPELAGCNSGFAIARHAELDAERRFRGDLPFRNHRAEGCGVRDRSAVDRQVREHVGQSQMVEGKVEFKDDGIGERTPGNGLDPRLIMANEFVDRRGWRGEQQAYWLGKVR